MGAGMNWMSDGPDWMHETSGVLRPAVEAYLLGQDMTPEQVASMRTYLRQWITTPSRKLGDTDALRQGVDGLTTDAAISQWLDLAAESNIDPL
jgi:hypothetical protein